MLCTNCVVRQYAVYRNASKEELERLAACRIAIVSLKKGQLMMSDQRNHPFVYTVLSGWAYAFALLRDGRRLILNFFSDGDLVSISALTGEGIAAPVRCLTEVKLCQFDKKRLLEVLESSPQLNAGLFTYFGQQRGRCDERLVQLGMLSAEEAVVSLIMSFVRREQERGQTGQEIVFPLRLSQIGEAVGITSIHAGRVMRMLEGQKVIKRLGADRLVIDQSRLDAMLPYQKAITGT